MKWWTAVIWVLVVSLVAGVGMYARSLFIEPAYAGRTLSEWMVKRQQVATMAEMEEADEAMRRIGTRGIPWMINWLRYDEAPWKTWKTKLYGIISQLPKGVVPFKLGNAVITDKQRQQGELAALMFYAVGPEATNAIPKLLSIMSERKRAGDSRRAASAIASVGNDAVPCLVAAFANASRSNRVQIVQLIGSMRADMRPGVPVLVSCLRGSDAELALEASRLLGILKLEPQVVVPELIGALTNRDCRIRAMSAEGLMLFGAAAKSAVPMLVAALDDSDSVTREAARGALLTLSLEELEKDAKTRPVPPRRSQPVFEPWSR